MSKEFPLIVVSLATFRREAKKYLKAVSEGEVIYLKKRGKVVAQVTKVEEPEL